MEQKGDHCQFEVQVYLNGLHPDFVKIEIYSEGAEDHVPIVKTMDLIQQFSGEANFYIYSASLPVSATEKAYTPRIVPYFNGLAVPLEDNHILWQK